MANSNELHVIFGTGPLGLSVMRELIQRGKQVRMINRSGKANVPSGVEIIASDAFDTTKTKAVTKGATHVYQCAQPAYWDWVTQFIPMQESIITGVAANGAKLIIGDNLYMYGDISGKVHEGLPYHAQTRKGKVRAEAATQALKAHESGRLQVSIGRAADFYGPGVLDSVMGDRVFAPMLAGKPAQAVGNIDLPHTYSYIEDFGKALVILGEHEEAFGQAWHIPNAPTITTRELIHIAYEQLGQTPKIATLGKFMMRIGGLFIPGARETVEMMYGFENPNVVDNSKFVAAFGDHATPHAEAIRRTLAWYKEHQQSQAA